MYSRSQMRIPLWYWFRGYRETLTLPRGPGPWPTLPAGAAAAAPTLALTAARALRESWPVPSTLTSAAGARSLLQGKGPFHSDQDPRPTTHPVNSACSDSPVLSVTGCNDMRKIVVCWTCGRTFWVWRLKERNFCSGKCRVLHHRSAFRRPGPSTSGRTPAGRGVGQSPMSALESISKSAPGSIFKSPLERAWYRVCLPVSM